MYEVCVFRYSKRISAITTLVIQADPQQKPALIRRPATRVVVILTLSPIWINSQDVTV